MVAGNQGVNLGTAYASVEFHTKGIANSIQDTQKQFDSLLSSVGNNLKSLGDNFTSLGGALGKLTAPLAAFGAAGIKVAGDFDSAMAAISARTGLVGEDLETVRQFALQMGADTAFSAQQAADGFLQLLTSGQSAEEALATLPVVLDAAAASGEDLGRTADTITDIMAAFNLGVDDAASVVDSLARAASSSSADMA
ncbi:MAG: phage tail tape measure protein, partial [Anaerolineae bacterium]|nr:phage tail tape measure protein [Anaerolineae bacterium]